MVEIGIEADQGEDSAYGMDDDFDGNEGDNDDESILDENTFEHGQSCNVEEGDEPTEAEIFGLNDAYHIPDNKGSSSRGKRIKSKKEMLVLQSQKAKRLCRICKQHVNHDKRNCPLKPKE
ncbi:hypothetical protein LXL04_017404 [Taraxacum kok-saghyz]